MTNHEVASLRIGSKIMYQYDGITEVDEGTVIGFGTYYESGETYADIDWYDISHENHIGIVQYSLQCLLGEAFKLIIPIKPVNLEEFI